MKDHYPSEKFSQAVDILATGLAPLQRRIEDAFSIRLMNLRAHHDKLPEEASDELRNLEAEWSAVEDSEGRGGIPVWADQLSDERAVEIASWIVETAALLNREYWSDD